MGGGLMQLVAYGAQDIYLTGNPQITFFKMVYKRHTNFSMESIEQTFNGTPDFEKKVSCTISRNGDLIHRIYVQLEVDSITEQAAWVNWLGHALIKSVELEIGGQRIDKHYGEWLHIWNELTQTAGHQVGYANMVGNLPALTMSTASTPSVMLFIPLQFWFCKNPGLALPLIALQYHEIKINIEFNTANHCIMNSVSNPSIIAKMKTCSLFVDYIYLDTDERKRFAQSSHEYLIEQLQFTGAESISSTNEKIKLNFNHPIKEIIWVVSKNEVANYTNKQWFNFTDKVDTTHGSGVVMDPLGNGMIDGILGSASGDVSLGSSNSALASNWASGLVSNLALIGGGIAPTSESFNVFDQGLNPVISARLQLNGHDRFAERNGRYFNLVQPYQHHKNVPSTGINVYSFALNPEDHQPSGTCNFSRIDASALILNLTNSAIANGGSKVYVFAVSYNILRIMSGMGGLAYTN